jgi:protein involved in polysaccharide export with SLBB domain
MVGKWMANYPKSLANWLWAFLHAFRVNLRGTVLVPPIGNLMISGLVAGKLFGPAEQRIDKAGKPFAVAKVLAASGDGETLIVNVIGFEPAVCSALQALGEGEPIALAGGLTPRVWTDKQGNTRPALDMVAHRVLTAYDASDSHPA